MRRYYSHYTYIQPDIYLKNHIVGIDDEGRILDIFPFEKEIERTEFYSGLLLFILDKEVVSKTFIEEVKRQRFLSEGKYNFLDHGSRYIMYHEDDIISTI